MCTAFAALLCSLAIATPDRPPNVVVIVSDDAAYGDFSMHGSEQMATPRIDSIAARGIRFSQGYTAASVCSPARAGLLTGRDPHHFGYERNPPPYRSRRHGLPVSEETLADVLRAAGYRTIALGKWHLGATPRYHPLQRGFDHFFGFLKGSRSYFPLNRTNPHDQLLRDNDPAPESFDYLTDALGEEAASVIAENADVPFFLYVAFNAVHPPLEAKPAALERAGAIADADRRTLVAMMSSLDEAVGRILDSLDTHGLRDGTLLFFVNDNGAVSSGSSNHPLRSGKGTLFEGGIRVPFAVQWPAGLPAGVVYDHPVSTIDLLPTARAASGRDYETKKPLDGVDLLPYLRGERTGRPHDALFWQQGESRAMRRGDLKIVRHKHSGQSGQSDWMLFDLAADPAEERDLAGARPETVAELVASFERWSGQGPHPPRP